jgi:serine O-acetyltransferase
MHPSSNSERLFKLFLRMLLKFGVYLSRILTKCEFQPRTVICSGIYLSDCGHIMLGARAIGSGTIIHNRVTIGKNNIGDRGHPEIGRNVWIGPQSVIYGNISIGDGVTILPNTVITRSVPPGVMIQGNPARVVKRLHDNSILRSTLSTDISHVMADICRADN